MKKIATLSTMSLCIATIIVLIYCNKSENVEFKPVKKYLTTQEIKDATYEFKKNRREKGWSKPDKPSKFIDFQNAIRTRSGETAPNYKPNYKLSELNKAMMRSAQLKSTKTMLDWIERGPGNVSGRTRGLIVDPDDTTENTWFTGSVGGGIWKTTDAGASWKNLTTNLPNLSTTCLALAKSNHNIIYTGTGEGFYNSDAIIGDGIFKSIDKGETWVQLESTAKNSDFKYINRIIVNPTNENIVLASTNASIQKSTDGGQSWTNVFDDNRRVQQIIASPSDFNIQYASTYAGGILKSTNAGDSWNYVLNNTSGRIEIAISPSNPNKVYASIENSELFISGDAGKSWSPSKIMSGSNELFLGSQGWYNNAIAVSPENEDLLLIGGINLFKVEVTGTAINSTSFFSVLNEGTESFMDFINHGAEYLGGSMELITSKTNYATIEIQFGPNKSQKAHRFKVPDGATSGVQASNYTYLDYVDVPFEVWDIENNRQLMVSFRDQDQNGEFNLTPLVDSLLIGREYVWINDLTYSESPSAMISTNGGHEYEEIAFWWPVLAKNAEWDAANIPNSKLTISRTEIYLKNLYSKRITHWYGADAPYIHADIHNIQITNNGRIIVTNDGGIAFSDDLGQMWNNPSNGYNTTQFYGVDKHPYENRYVGGLQDNGTWVSSTDPTNLSAWDEATGGDGFDAVWNANDPNKIIASMYNNELFISNNEGKNWSNRIDRIEESGSTNAPFITQIGYTPAAPEMLYIVSASGVSVSENFGQSWQMININDSTWSWGGNGYVEPSLSYPEIVWAATTMENNSHIQVSKDGGHTYSAVNNYEENMGLLSGLATHPRDTATVYALFSYSESPKILRSTDFGNSWSDITGFENGESSNGFPDVAVYSLLVMPNNTDIIWAGTEIGLFISTNNGESWEYANNGLPAVSIWELKIRGNQVLVATHGRGIWTVELPELENAISAPKLLATGTNAYNETILLAEISPLSDSVQVIIDGEKSYKLMPNEINPGINKYTFNFELDEGYHDIQLFAFSGENTLKSIFQHHLAIQYKQPQTGYTTSFDEESDDFVGNGFTIRAFGALGAGMAIHTDHPYAENSNFLYYLKTPIVIGDTASTNSNFNYKDIPMLEEGFWGSQYNTPNFFDYLVVESSTDGINWKPLIDGYDFKLIKVKAESLNKTVDSRPTMSMFTKHDIDLSSIYSNNDTILIRYRMFSDFNINGWGCVIDDINIAQTNLVSNKDLSKKLNSVYPNPCIETLHIELNETFASDAIINIYNLSGQKVIQQSVTEQTKLNIETEQLVPAIYILEIKSGYKIETQRFEKIN